VPTGQPSGGAPVGLPHLLRALGSLSDLELRTRRAGELLAALPAREAAPLLEALLRSAGRREEPARTVLIAVQRGLRSHLPLAHRDELRREAVRCSARELGALLSEGAAARSFDRDREEWVDTGLRTLTLGQRKQLARAHDPDLLARLASDPDPAVIRNLLANPRLVERQVVGLASRRPVRAAVLEEVLRSRRWAQNLSVRRAVALNPYAPPALAAAALPLLTRAELREVAGSLGLDGELRALARRLLDRSEAPAPAAGQA
jgi:hypothetical protein